jgi:hypothetical protein
MMPTYYDTLVHAQQLQELKTMPTFYGTLVQTPAAPRIEDNAHLLWHTCTYPAVTGAEAMHTCYGTLVQCTYPAVAGAENENENEIK